MGKIELENKNDFVQLNFEERSKLNDVELERYYNALQEYYMSLPFDSSKRDRQEFVYRLCTLIGGPLLKALYNPKLIGKELLPKEKGSIYVSNHLTYYDQFLLACLLGLKRAPHYMASSEFLHKKRGVMYRGVGAVFVDRDDPESKKNAQIEQTQLSFHGRDIALFTEGTRKPTQDALKDFKRGAFIISQTTGKPISPMAINGDWTSWLKFIPEIMDEVFKLGLNQKRMAEISNEIATRKPIARVCSEPIYIGHKDDIDEVMDMVWNIIFEGIEKNDELGFMKYPNQQFDIEYTKQKQKAK